MNLNEVLVNCDGTVIKQSDFSTSGCNNDIEVYFKNIEKVIIDKIKKYKYVVGCIAWLTNENILKELAKKEECLIIVQDEDFLRPDIDFDGNMKSWKNKIFKLYNNIKKIDTTCLVPIGINILSTVKTGIRRCGMLNTDKKPAFPRMHNKFIIVFNDAYIYDEKEEMLPDPVIEGEVITGSYNYTENSNNSLENIVCIKDNNIISAYYKQFGEIAIMSVPLKWSKEWKPSKSGLRYGT